jgi:DDE family transposase
MDVALSLQKGRDLRLTELGRHLKSSSRIKHRVKKVDRLESNRHLHGELDSIYKGLSEYVLTLLSQDKSLLIIVDLCFVKDDGSVQMLSAEVATKGRTIPVYRQVFSSGKLAGRALSFLQGLSRCLPSDREVIIIMDAGFHDDWFTAIESLDWYWICWTRTGKSLKLSVDSEWVSVKEFIATVKERTKDYESVILSKRHERQCRLVTTRRSMKQAHKRLKPSSEKRRKVASGSYVKSAKEPWLLATNLPKRYRATKVIHYYSQRMQIEESFRDVKSHRFGLAGRYIGTTCVHRWAVKMLLAAIAQIIYWIIGIIGHSQNMQKEFQANTVKNKKVFSYFTLGKLIIEFDKLHMLDFNQQKLSDVMQYELSRDW